MIESTWYEMASGEESDGDVATPFANMHWKDIYSASWALAECAFLRVVGNIQEVLALVQLNYPTLEPISAGLRLARLANPLRSWSLARTFSFLTRVESKSVACAVGLGRWLK